MTDTELLTKADAEYTPQDWQQRLTQEAQEAYDTLDFNTRNEKMVGIVAKESAYLAAASIDKPNKADDLEKVFTQAALDAGMAFSPVFDDSEGDETKKTAAYKIAMNSAGAAAFKNLDEALTAAEIQVDIKSILKKVTFMDVLRLTARQIGKNLPEGLTPEVIKKSLHRNSQGDYFESQIDSLPYDDANHLTDDEEKGLDIAVRLANATWKVGQVHRAIKEGNTSRIDPNVREVFNPFDLLKEIQYNRVHAASIGADAYRQVADQDALLKVALEVYKDILQYKPLVS